MKPERVRHILQTSRDFLIREDNLMWKAKEVLSWSEREFSLYKIREVNNRTYKQMIKTYLTVVPELVKDTPQHKYRPFLILSGLFIFYIWLPFVVIMMMYSAIYPIMCFALTPWKDIGLLQQTLTVIYVCTCSLLLLLAPKVYYFRRVTAHLMMFGYYQGATLDMWFEIEAQYQTIREKIFLQNYLESIRMPKDLATLCAEYVEEPVHEGYQYFVEAETEQKMLLDEEKKQMHDLTLHVNDIFRKSPQNSNWNHYSRGQERKDNKRMDEDQTEVEEEEQDQELSDGLHSSQRRMKSKQYQSFDQYHRQNQNPLVLNST